MKTILFCGNGMSAEIVPRVREWGYRVVVITDFASDPGLEFADYVTVAKTKDPVEALNAAREIWNSGYHFDGVISLCWDCAVSVSTVAKEFGLRGIPIAAAMNATLKDLRSRLFVEKNIPAPTFAICDNFEEVAREAGRIGYPIIIKPIDQSSSKGVVVVYDDSRLKLYYEHSLSYSACAKVILNQYVIGTEHSVEGLVVAGEFFPTGITDRVFEYERYSPHFVEVGDIMPTALATNIVKRCYEVTGAAALALGINDGPAKSDLIVNNDGEVFVLELAARLGGPRLGTEMIPLGNGTCVLRAAIQQAVGDEVDFTLLQERYKKGMVNRSIFPNPGRVAAIHGLDDLATVTGFYDFKWWNAEGLRIGDVIDEPTYGCGGVGYLISTGATRAEAILSADIIQSKIVIDTHQDSESIDG